MEQTTTTEQRMKELSSRFISGLASRYLQEASTTPEFTRASIKLGNALEDFSPARIEAIEFLTQVQMLAAMKITIKRFIEDAKAFDDLIYALDVESHIDKLELSPAWMEELTSIYTKNRGFSVLNEIEFKEYQSYMKDSDTAD